MLRIGIACYPSIGGSGIVATQLGHELCLRGHQVHYFSYDVPVRMLQCECSCEFHHVDVPAYPLMRFPPYAMALASKLYEIACEPGLDVIHVHYAIPHSMSALLAKQMIQRTTGRTIPFVTTLHGTDTYLVGQEPSYRAVVQHCLQESDAVTAVSEHLRQETIRIFELSKPVEVIHNFVECKPLPEHRLKDIGRAETGRTLIHVSNFRSLKRVEDALQVFELVSRACPCCRMVMVGDGPETAAAHKLAEQLGISDQVTFVGRATDVVHYMNSADLLLSTSEIESFGLAIAEAMACAMPVVCTRVGGVPEVVEHGKTGFLCDTGDVCGMACAVLQILTNPSRARSMGIAGRERVEKYFSPDVIVPKYETLYQNLLSSFPSSAEPF